eukprot:Gb_34023 [translate_table: standard]
MTGTPKLDFVKRLGTYLVIDYINHTYEQVYEKFDFVFVFNAIGDSHKSYVLANKEGKIIDIASCHPYKCKGKIYFSELSRGSNLERVE